MKRFFIIFFLLTASFCFSVPKIFLEITKNFTEKADIVLLLEIEKTPYWNNFASTLQKDLIYSGYFNIEGCSFVKNLKESLKQFPVDLIVTLKEKGDGKVLISVLDTLEEQNLFEKEYKFIEDPFYFAHVVNDDIIFALTEKPGIAKSRILFVSDKTGKYQIYITDYDGRNTKQITNFDFLVNFPVWFPDRKGFYFVSYEKGYPQICKFYFENKKIETIFSYPGLNACISPCKVRDILAVVLSKSGNPEIYITSTKGKIIRRLTYTKGIESSPSLSPDGKNVVFVSDRYGTPQIFIMDTEGFGLRRISYISSYCTSPKWSPDGNYIAYIVMFQGLKIAVYDLKTKKTKILPNSHGCEAISWASDSRHIVFTKADVLPSRLSIIDIFTGETRNLTSSEYNSFSPDWEKF